MPQTLKNLVSRIGKGEKGFTLIEMLVVVGIIVSLAAVIVPAVVKFASEGETGAQAAERVAVQVAVDVMMADLRISTLTGNAVPAKLTDSTDLIGGQTLAGYLRDSTSKYCYTWDSTGKFLTQSAC